MRDFNHSVHLSANLLGNAVFRDQPVGRCKPE